MPPQLPDLTTQPRYLNTELVPQVFYQVTGTSSPASMLWQDAEPSSFSFDSATIHCHLNPHKCPWLTNDVVWIGQRNSFIKWPLFKKKKDLQKPPTCKLDIHHENMGGIFWEKQTNKQTVIFSESSAFSNWMCWIICMEKFLSLPLKAHTTQ